MRVNIDAQYLCTDNLRGVPYYILNLTESLVKRNKNDYSVSFFSYEKEYNHQQYIEKYFSPNTYKKLKIHSCSDLSFNEIKHGNYIDDSSGYDSMKYNEYFNTNSDIWHFPHAHNIPRNIDINRTVVTVHDIMPLISYLERGWNEKSVLEFKHSINYIKQNNQINIIAVSSATKNDLIKYLDFSSERIFVVPNGYNNLIHYPEKNYDLLKNMGIEGPYLLYLAAIDLRKGILDILSAFEQIKTVYPELKLVFAGKRDSNADVFFETLNTFKYKSDVILTGFVTDEQKRVLMSSAEVFLFPSEYEGFGLPVIEAMACGCPVITTNVSSLPEAGGNAAIYISPGSPEEMAENAIKLLNSEYYKNTIIKKGFEHIKKFTWDKTAELTEKVYFKINSR